MILLILWVLSTVSGVVSLGSLIHPLLIIVLILLCIRIARTNSL